MTNLFGAVFLAELAIIALLLVRLAIGPTVSDRIVALNTIATQATLAVLVFAPFADRTIYLDVSIWLASFSYPRELLTVAGVVAAALPVGRFLLSRRAAPVVSRVRSVQTGSVNDYAAYLTLGLIGSVLALIAR